MKREHGYLLKQNEIYRKKRKELDDLKEELINYKKSLGTGVDDFKVSDYNLKLSKLSREYYSVLLSRYLDLNDSTLAIAHFLSSVTGKNYGVYEYKVILYKSVYPSILNPSYNRPKPIRYTVCFLAPSDSINFAYSELDSLFRVKDCNNYDSYYKVKDALRSISDNFIILAYYKGDMNGKRIEYTYDNFVSVSDVPDSFVVSQLNDDRYSYILDYIDRVIEYKLDSPVLSVSLDEMKMIADNMGGKVLKK